MAKLFLEIIKKQMRVKKKIDKDLYWYDHDIKQMRKFRGGKVVTKYDPVSKKTYPSVEDDEEHVYKSVSNKEDILEWIQGVGKRYYNVEIDRFEANSQGIGIEFDDHHKSRLEYDLDRHDIRYKSI